MVRGMWGHTVFLKLQNKGKTNVKWETKGKNWHEKWQAGVIIFRLTDPIVASSEEFKSNYVTTDKMLSPHKQQIDKKMC